VSSVLGVKQEVSILEIFASRQGEGICAGDPQIFIRLAGCNVSCDYCDTPEGLPAAAGRSVALDEIVNQVTSLSGGKPGVVSLTGGEPLVQVDFLVGLLPVLRSRGYRIYLETNGTLPGALERIVGECDWIAMDLKPESAIGSEKWEAHRWFLEVAGSKVFVKMPLTDRTREEEFQRAVSLIAGARPIPPFVLQPVTAWGSVKSIPLARLASWWQKAAQALPDVRILPQLHRLWGIP
jgi:7-carboxy-7-deazaguanine synthase